MSIFKYNFLVQISQGELDSEENRFFLSQENKTNISYNTYQSAKY